MRHNPVCDAVRLFSHLNKRFSISILQTILSTKTFPLLAFAALLAGGVAIGFAGIFMRLSDVNPLASAFWRMALAAPVLWAWAWMTRQRDVEDDKLIAFSLPLIWCGFFFAGDMAVWHLSLHFTTVSNATLLSNFAPIFIAVWLWFAYRMRFQRLFLLGMMLALAGALLLIGTGTAEPSTAGNKLLGDGLGLFSAVFYGAYQLVIKNARERYSTARLMAWSTTLTGVFLLPLAIGSPGAFWPSGLSGWWAVLALALVAQIAGQTVIAYASAHLSASLSSVSLLIQPLTATIAAWVLFHEAIGLLQMGGGVLLLWGIYLAKKGS